MLKWESIAQEIESRMADVVGVKSVARNPKVPPNIDAMPAICIFEMEDDVVDKSLRGGFPIYKREADVVIEYFDDAVSEETASTATASLLEQIKKKLYRDGARLGGLCSELVETKSGRMLRPDAGNHLAGRSLFFVVTYIEEISLLM